MLNTYCDIRLLKNKAKMKSQHTSSCAILISSSLGQVCSASIGSGVLTAIRLSCLDGSATSNSFMTPLDSIAISLVSECLKKVNFMIVNNVKIPASGGLIHVYRNNDDHMRFMYRRHYITLIIMSQQQEEVKRNILVKNN